MIKIVAAILMIALALFCSAASAQGGWGVDGQWGWNTDTYVPRDASYMVYPQGSWLGGAVENPQASLVSWYTVYNFWGQQVAFAGVDANGGNSRMAYDTRFGQFRAPDCYPFC